MNVFHKVLLKIFELTGGKEAIEVDLAELLKKEGFYSSIESISQQLQDESWITEAGRKNIFKITHWGVAEAKRLKANGPDKVSDVDKHATRFLNEARELIKMLEEFAAKPEPKGFERIEKRLSELNEHSKVIRQHL